MLENAQWKEDYIIGNDTIDNQHKYLFEIAGRVIKLEENDLLNGLRSGNENSHKNHTWCDYLCVILHNHLDNNAQFDSWIYQTKRIAECHSNEEHPDIGIGNSMQNGLAHKAKAPWFGGERMKYLVGLILIGIGLYLFYSIRNGGMPDIPTWLGDEENEKIE